MDIEKLIDRLRTESLYAGKASLEIMDLCMAAADALSTLQAENEKLKDQLYDGEGVNLVNYWIQQAKIEENGHRNCQAENEQLRVELEKMKHGRWIDAESDDGRTVWHCSKCSYPIKTIGGYPIYKYCPMCGARMGKEDGHEVS